MVEVMMETHRTTRESNGKRYRDASRLCKEPGCATPLGYRNTSGYCMRHHYPQDRPSVAVPKTWCQECGKQLTVRNRSGYCAQHRYPQNRSSVPKTRCQECGTPLRFKNTTGYCQDHYYLSPQAQDLRKAWKRGRALKTKIIKAKSILAEHGMLAMPKGGRSAEDKRAAKVDGLYNQGMKWSAIQAQVEAEFQVHTTVKALQELRRRWVKRQKATQ